MLLKEKTEEARMQSSIEPRVALTSCSGSRSAGYFPLPLRLLCCKGWTRCKFKTRGIRWITSPTHTKKKPEKLSPISTYLCFHTASVTHDCGRPLWAYVRMSGCVLHLKYASLTKGVCWINDSLHLRGVSRWNQDGSLFVAVLSWEQRETTRVVCTNVCIYIYGALFIHL